MNQAPMNDELGAAGYGLEHTGPAASGTLRGVPLREHHGPVVVEHASIPPSAQDAITGLALPWFGVDLGGPEEPADSGVTATLVDSGTARIEFRLTPDDRRQLRRSNQVEAFNHAEKIGSPAGLRGLFPTNQVRMVAKKRPALTQPKQETAPDAQPQE